MGKAKKLLLKPIPRKDADRVVKRLHYSGKVVNNTQISIGAFYDGRLEGALQFGCSLDKRKIQGLVSGTGWNEFLELNRMAFSDKLPRNSESRAIAICMKLLKKYAPHVKWVISFADATQCGDGTIYRASGFVLTGIKKNTQIWVSCDGARFSRTSLTDGRSKSEQRKAVSRVSLTKGKHVLQNGGASMQQYIDAGFTPLDGYQLRYIYFIDKSYKGNLTVPILPFSEIDKMGARMYKGKNVRRRRHSDAIDSNQ